MVAETETLVFGIPVPSDDRFFLAIVAVHILLGVVCVFSGLSAMLANKGQGAHSKSGKIYYWALLLVFVSVIPLSIMRWPHNTHLLILGGLSFGTAYFGRRLTRHQSPRWTRLHTILMGSSYIFLLTAFYVDNGKNLPLWNLLPHWSYWIFPPIIGIPIIINALIKHPRNRRALPNRAPD